MSEIGLEVYRCACVTTRIVPDGKPIPPRMCNRCFCVITKIEDRDDIARELLTSYRGAKRNIDKLGEFIAQERTLAADCYSGLYRHRNDPDGQYKHLGLDDE